MSPSRHLFSFIFSLYLRGEKKPHHIITVLHSTLHQSCWLFLVYYSLGGMKSLAFRTESSRIESVMLDTSTSYSLDSLIKKTCKTRRKWERKWKMWHKRDDEDWRLFLNRTSILIPLIRRSSSRRRRMSQWIDIKSGRDVQHGPIPILTGFIIVYAVLVSC